jgi:protein O-GlcNAc transferase
MRQILPTAAAVLLAASLVAAAPATQLQRQQALQHYRNGQKAMDSENFALAVREFTQAVQLDPQLVMGHYGLGQARMATKEYPQAVLAYKGAIAAHVELAQLQVSDQQAADQRIDEEIRELQESVRLFSGGAAKSQQPGNVVLGLEERIRSLEAQKRTGGGNVEVPAEFSLALGSAYFRSNALDDAARAYEAAIKVKPKFGEAHNNLAVVYMLQGKIPEAEQHVKLAEKASYKVHPQLKEDIKKRKAS